MKKILGLFALAVAALLPSVAGAEVIVGLTAGNQVLRFDSATPGTTQSMASITGLVSGDVLMGIDTRPANGVLYGFAINGAVGRVYTINSMTGAAALVSTLAADPTDLTAPFPFGGVSGSFFGVDFNPAVDRLRIVSNTGQNLRVNVTTGLTQLDVGLNYPGAGDPNSGSQPNVVAAAYTNNVAGAPGGTQLYAIDADANYLVLQNPPNNGTLNSIALLGLGATVDAGFDISSSGIAFVVFEGLTLSTLNLLNGNVTSIGEINTPGFIVDFAVAVPEPGSMTLLGIAIVGGGTRWWRKRRAAVA